jgi:hypothetical protein
MKLHRSVRISAVLFWLFSGCGASTGSRVGGGGACVDGATISCACPGAPDGTQTCQGGQFGDCQCAPGMCGDNACTGGETCTSCPGDCGPCPMCSAAPSCTDAVGVPTMPKPRPDLDVNPASTPDGGAAAPSVQGPDCKDPQLRLRIAKIDVAKGGGSLYCIVTASDGNTSEVALTTKTKDLGDGDTNYFDPSVAVFWGQKGLATTTNNLTITYDCWKVGSDAWANVLMAMSMAAQMAGGIAGPYGWAFGAAATASAAAAAAAQSASGDDHRLNQQQTISKGTLLDLTNGRSWQVRGSGGCGLFCSWDWTLTVESWGCADARGTPQ